jgi:hypothetical protein
MHLLAYFPACRQAGHPYRQLLEDSSSCGGSEFYDSLEGFRQRLEQPARDGSVVVLVLDSAEDMNAILSLGDLLGDLPLAVVLPNHDPALVGRAHLLRPRFLTYLDQEPGVLLQVLANIARKHWPGIGPPLSRQGKRPPCGVGER